MTITTSVQVLYLSLQRVKPLTWDRAYWALYNIMAVCSPIATVKLEYKGSYLRVALGEQMIYVLRNEPSVVDRLFYQATPPRLP